jgi:hypothetical protein
MVTFVDICDGKVDGVHERPPLVVTAKTLVSPASSCGDGWPGRGGRGSRVPVRMQLPGLPHATEVCPTVPVGTSELGRGILETCCSSGPETTVNEGFRTSLVTPAHHVGVTHVARTDPLTCPTTRPAIVPLVPILIS